MKNGSFGFGDIKVFTGNANKPLGEAIAKHLGMPLTESVVYKFSDSETYVKFDETVRGSDVFIIQPTSAPVNDHVMELLIMTDALRRASAGRITAVVPYFGYSRQDRKDRSHAPITAKLVANLLTAAGVDRVISMDLHSPQVQGFFDVPFDHLRGTKIFARYYNDNLADRGEFVVASPDLGSVGRVGDFAKRIDLPMVIVNKHRLSPDVSKVVNVIGGEAIKGRNVLILDDVASTAGSLVNAAKALKDLGAKEMYACVAHPAFSAVVKERVENSVLDKLIVLDTINVPEEYKPMNIEILSVAEYFAEAITHIHEGKAISTLFD